MGRRVRIEFLDDGFRALLNAGAVRDDLEARAARIAASAGDGFEVVGTELSFGGASRPGFFVQSDTREAQLAEASDKALTSAIDAGR